MKVTLLNSTPLWIASKAIRTCWQSQEKSDTIFTCLNDEEQTNDECECGEHDAFIMGDTDLALIDRIGNKNKHASTLEHITYNFYIEGVSRALLQELARHRIASLSVKSTRYTLKELKEEAPFVVSPVDIKNINVAHTLYELEVGKRAGKYLVYTGVELVDWFSVNALENLRQILEAGISNDRAKYCLPESYKTDLSWSINMRSLQNFISLRSDKAALWEIRELATAVHDALPEDHKYLFVDSLKTYEN